MLRCQLSVLTHLFQLNNKSAAEDYGSEKQERRFPNRRLDAGHPVLDSALILEPIFCLNKSIRSVILDPQWSLLNM